jgi:hypothetical protein
VGPNPRCVRTKFLKSLRSRDGPSSEGYGSVLRRVLKRVVQPLTRGPINRHRVYRCPLVPDNARRDEPPSFRRSCNPHPKGVAYGLALHRVTDFIKPVDQEERVFSPDVGVKGRAVGDRRGERALAASCPPGGKASASSWVGAGWRSFFGGLLRPAFARCRAGWLARSTGLHLSRTPPLRPSTAGGTPALPEAVCTACGGAFFTTSRSSPSLPQNPLACQHLEDMREDGAVVLRGDDVGGFVLEGEEVVVVVL